MSETTIPVKAETAPAGTQQTGVEANGSVAPQTTEVIDYKAELEKLQSKYGIETAKLASERDNYREGLLIEKAKKGSDDDQESDDDRFRRIAREELARTNQNAFNAEKEALLEKVVSQNKELSAALKNRTGLSNTAGSAGAGSGQGSPEVAPKYLANDQVAFLKSRGWDDKKIERFIENDKKNKQNRV